jgi:hypothetical protein
MDKTMIRMKKIFFWCCALFFLPGMITAGEVTVAGAGKAALKFYSDRAKTFLNRDMSNAGIRETFAVKENGLSLYYIFNIDPEGWVIVAAENSVRPVLAYSFVNQYDPEIQPPQFRAWMRQYAGQIEFVAVNKIKPSGKITEQWDYLLSDDTTKMNPDRDQRDVSPLIYSNWNQNSPYNEYCPVDPGGPGGHVYAGCVPVAMGQIMYYYRWPDHGTGEYTDIDTTYGTLHVNYDSTWYQWNNMKNSINTSNDGIAELLYKTGVACDLVYGPKGSGMYNHKAAYAFRTFFKYSPETQYVFRDSTSLDWDSLIIAHLDRRMPLYYAGWSVPDTEGHAFVCDGYQGSDYFHFNFGWSSSGNGYYYLDSIAAGGGTFNLAQELIINIFPDTLYYNYPQYCSGSQHLTKTEGSITDGSGPVGDYQPGTDCMWLIDPQTDTDSVSSITLTFDEINILPGDSLVIYNGETIGSPVFAGFTGITAIPSPVTCNGNKMLVRFKTATGLHAPGWSANYSSTFPDWCRSSSSIVTDTLDLTDGSFRFNYHNNTSCRWNIRNTTGDTLTIYFRSFDTEAGKDLLKIFDGDHLTAPPLAVISGHYDSLDLPVPVSSPSGKMLVLFFSNSSVTDEGWNIYYPKLPSIVKDNGSVIRLKVFPNPASGNFSIQFSLPKATNIDIRLSDIRNHEVLKDSFMGKPGMNEKVIEIGKMVPGIYLLSVQSSEFIITKKIIVTD